MRSTDTWVLCGNEDRRQRRRLLPDLILNWTNSRHVQSIVSPGPPKSIVTETRQACAVRTLEVRCPQLQDFFFWGIKILGRRISSCLSGILTIFVLWRRVKTIPSCTTIWPRSAQGLSGDPFACHGHIQQHTRKSSARPIFREIGRVRLQMECLWTFTLTSCGQDCSESYPLHMWQVCGYAMCETVDTCTHHFSCFFYLFFF